MVIDMLLKLYYILHLLLFKGIIFRNSQQFHAVLFSFIGEMKKQG